MVKAHIRKVKGKKVLVKPHTRKTPTPTIKNFFDLVGEIKEMNTYKQIVKDSFGGVMYNVANKEKYNKDINKKFKQLEKMGFDIWNTTDGIFRGVYTFIMRD